MPPTLMYIEIPLCTATNMGHEISCFVAIIKTSDYKTKHYDALVISPTPQQHHGCDCCEYEVFHFLRLLS